MKIDERYNTISEKHFFHPVACELMPVGHGFNHPSDVHALSSVVRKSNSHWNLSNEFPLVLTKTLAPSTIRQSLSRIS